MLISGSVARATVVTLATSATVLIPCLGAIAQGITATPNDAGTQIQQNGSEFTINGGTFSGDGANLFHSFEQFGLTPGQIATFESQPQIMNILGRVTGGSPSVIQGLIQVTGGSSNLMLMNPAGMIFGAGASLNVPGDFTATTADRVEFANGQLWSATGANDYLALNGAPQALIFGDDSRAIINTEQLDVAAGQTLTLAGSGVIHTGSLTAPGGHIQVSAIAATDKLRLTPPGRLLSFDVTAPTDAQGQPLPLRPVDIPELVTGSETIAHLEQNLPSVDLTKPLPAGTSAIAGKLDVSDTLGGTVDVIGEIVALIGAEIDATGTHGGGAVNVGGERNHPTLAAQHTVVDESSFIDASALTSGDGGQVNLWSERGTAFEGTLQTQGGATGGDGGFAEISGRETLQVSGVIRQAAPQGEVGELLLDPTNIEVVSSSQAETTNLNDVLQGQPDIGGDGDTKIDVAVINNASGTVTLQADEDITFSTRIDMTTPGAGLRAEAGANITVNKKIEAQGDVELIAGQDVTVDADIEITRPNADITVAADRDITVTEDLTTQGGDVTLLGNTDNNGGGAVTLRRATIETNGGDVGIAGEGHNSVANGVTVINKTVIDAGGGDITVTGQGGQVPGENNHNGIEVERSTLQTEGNGAIALTGIGGSGDKLGGGGRNLGGNTGVRLRDATLSGEAEIHVNGTGGTQGTNNDGVRLHDGQAFEAQTITLTGTGGQGMSTNPNFREAHSGIACSGCTVTADLAPGGTLQFSGTGGNDPNNSPENNDGIAINNAAWQINNGSLSLEGTGGDDGEYTDGVHLQGSSIAIAGSGNLTINGTAGQGEDNTYGIYAPDLQSLQTADGSIELRGKGSASTNSAGMLLSGDGTNPTIESHGGGVTLIGQAAETSIQFTDGVVKAKDGPIEIRGQELNGGLLTRDLWLTGTNLETAGDRVDVDGRQMELNKITSNGGPIDMTLAGTMPSLNVSDRLNSSHANGGGAITITGSDGLGQVIIPNLIANSIDQAAGSITVRGVESVTSIGIISATGQFAGGNVTLDVARNITTGNVKVINSAFGGDGGAIAFTSQFGTISTIAGQLITGTANGNGGDITLNAGQDLFLAGLEARSLSSQPGGRIDLTAQDRIYSQGSITTNDAPITFNAPVTLQGQSTWTALDNGMITLQDTVDGAFALDVEAKMIRAFGAIGGTTPLTRLIAQGDIQNPTTNPLSITTQGQLTTFDVRSPAGLEFTSLAGSIQTGSLDSSTAGAIAGNLTMSAAQNLAIAAIDAQSVTSTGGNVQLLGQNVRLTDTFTDQNGLLTSLSVAGSQGGTAIIRHGGNGVVPFRMGDSTINGAEAAISRGTGAIATIDPVQDFFLTHKQDQDRLQIISIALELSPPTSLPIAPIESPPLRGTNPVENLALLVGDLINADTRLQHNAQTGNYAVAWDVPAPSGNDIVQLTVNASNPGLSPLSTFATLEWNQTDDLITDVDQLLEAEIEQHFGENLGDRRVTAQSLQDTLQDIEAIADNRAVILYAIPYPDELQLILISPDAPPQFKTVTETNFESLSKTVRQFRRRLHFTRSDSYRPAGQRLHDWLIAPWQDTLAELSIDTLIFAGSGPLRSLPLAAVSDGDQFLVEQYSVGTVPSLSLTDTSYTSLAESSVLAMGAAEFPTAIADPLRAVPHELAAIGQLRAGETLLNADFTVDNLRDRQSHTTFGIVHLATHAAFESQAPQRSHIQFWDQKVSIQTLRESRWYTDQPMELLVLSACETALGDPRAELGFAGLAVHSGAKSAIASLWRVDDLATLGLMREFYTALGSADITIKAEALRQAQLAFLQSGPAVRDTLMDIVREQPELTHILSQHSDLSHPYFWAGFTVVGSPW